MIHSALIVYLCGWEIMQENDEFEMIDGDFGVIEFDELSEDEETCPEVSQPMFPIIDVPVVKAGLFAKTLSRREQWEARNPIIKARVYDPTGTQLEIRKVTNNKNQLACWHPLTDKLIYSFINKDGSCFVGKVPCTKQVPAAAQDVSNLKYNGI